MGMKGNTDGLKPPLQIRNATNNPKARDAHAQAKNSSTPGTKATKEGPIKGSSQTKR